MPQLPCLAQPSSSNAEKQPVQLWCLPIAPLTMTQTLDRIDDLIHDGKPRYLITANLNYAMLAARDPRLLAATRGAAFVVADGMPYVWAARLKGRKLPGRVTGADLVPAVCERAGDRGYRVLLAGGTAGVAEVAAKRLRQTYPGLELTAMEAPHFRRAEAGELAAFIDQVRAVRPDILLLACSQPEGELWLAQTCNKLGVPACIQIGAAVDFAAGRVRRAPRLVQRLGMEWAFRLSREPARLAARYWKNAVYLLTNAP